MFLPQAYIQQSRDADIMTWHPVVSCQVRRVSSGIRTPSLLRYNIDPTTVPPILKTIVLQYLLIQISFTSSFAPSQSWSENLPVSATHPSNPRPKGASICPLNQNSMTAILLVQISRPPGKTTRIRRGRLKARHPNATRRTVTQKQDLPRLPLSRSRRREKQVISHMRMAESMRIQCYFWRIWRRIIIGSGWDVAYPTSHPTPQCLFWRNEYAVNEEDFRNSQKDFASFIEQLSELVTEKDSTIPELPSKDIVCWIPRSILLP